jgi:DNA-binding response OmpR family regulator
MAVPLLGVETELPPLTDNPDVLLVACTADVAADVRARLTEAGMRLSLVDTFAAAREHLQSLPSLLISEVRLGEYNGLHLAMRARASGIPAIILGETDPVTEREAHKLGAAYVRTDGDPQELAMALCVAGFTEPVPGTGRSSVHVT